MSVVDVMKSKIAITISAFCVSLYGLVGFWINIGNETIKPVLFVSIMAANVIALLLIILSAYNWSKKQLRKNTLKNGFKCLIISALCFAVLAVLLANSDYIENSKLYSLIIAVFIASGTMSIVYSISFILISFFIKHK